MISAGVGRNGGTWCRRVVSTVPPRFSFMTANVEADRSDRLIHLTSDPMDRSEALMGVTAGGTAATRQPGAAVHVVRAAAGRRWVARSKRRSGPARTSPDRTRHQVG